MRARFRARHALVPFHHPESHVYRLVGPHVDPISKSPQYKVTDVRLRRAPVEG